MRRPLNRTERNLQMRKLLAGAVVGALLMLGGQALADIPDSQPSVVDSTHTFYACVRQGSAAMRPVYALDKTLGNCSTGWDEKHLAPVIPAAP